MGASRTRRAGPAGRAPSPTGGVTSQGRSGLRQGGARRCAGRRVSVDREGRGEDGAPVCMGEAQRTA
eukprot:scaffold2871_cov381-Prasinococcus_capsulatus_cf.AAC.15